MTRQGVGRALRLAEGAKNYAESCALGKSGCTVYDFLIIGQKHLRDHSIDRINQYRDEPSFKLKLSRAN